MVPLPSATTSLERVPGVEVGAGADRRRAQRRQLKQVDDVLRVAAERLPRRRLRLLAVADDALEVKDDLAPRPPEQHEARIREHGRDGVRQARGHVAPRQQQPRPRDEVQEHPLEPEERRAHAGIVYGGGLWG